jgi:GNAT superfamily N-acetyltransferase
MTRVTTTHLELRSPAAFKPSVGTPGDLVLKQVATPSPELSRLLYTAVGGDYHWTDRLAWTWAEWMAWLSRPEVETWVAYRSDAPVGYFELEAQEGGSVEIVYFGLLPSFVGQGLGGYLLTQAVHRAFVMRPDVTRVWLHTCTLDHPAGLGGYRSRGFAVFKQEEENMSLPGQFPGARAGVERPR